MKIFSGIPVAPGIVIGKALLVSENNPEIPRYSITDTASELERFVKAVEAAAADMRLLKENARGMNREQETILEAHLLMVEDPDFHYQIKARIESKLENIEWIVGEVSRELSQKLALSPDAYLRERAADVTDVSRWILDRLMGIKRFSLTDLAEDAILVGRNFLPSDILAMDKTRVKALAMDKGSGTCHSAILVRSFGIPSVMGISTASREISGGELLILDGTKGKVILDPDPATLEQYGEQAVREGTVSARRELLKDLPAVTLDGRRVSLNANIGMPGEVERISQYGVDGIGLYRSEILFLTPCQASEENQYRSYSNVLQAMKGKPVTIRTADLGGDKMLPGFQGVEEANPLLGWRAIRFSLSLPEMFKIQLRAILRASVEGKVKILFPLISGIEELEEALGLLEQVKEEFRDRSQSFAEDIEVGTMIEVPAAVMTADILAEKSDFFSIGTNDLVQYSLAVDRGNEKVNYLAQPLHPAILRLLAQTIDAAHKRGIKAAMCGELAGDPAMTPLLLGLGLDEFSMAGISVPSVKHIIRNVYFADCKALAEKALACTSYKQVIPLLQNWSREHIQE